MRITLISVKFLKWETGIWFGSDTAKYEIFKLEAVFLGVGIKLIGIDVG